MLNEEIAHIARLIGDHVRSTILIALMEGRALTAGELAIRANVSAQTASNHLAKLMSANLVVCEPAGRHRYYKLASTQVAHILESLGVLTLSSEKITPPQHQRVDQELCFARTCYDHLAGEVGVKLTKALVKKGLLIEEVGKFLVTDEGGKFFKGLGIDIEHLQGKRRQFAKPCLDWTEREHHIAGSLGAALLDYLLNNRLVIRSKKKHRVVVLTVHGRNWLKNYFDFWRH